MNLQFEQLTVKPGVLTIEANAKVESFDAVKHFSVRYKDLRHNFKQRLIQQTVGENYTTMNLAYAEAYKSDEKT